MKKESTEFVAEHTTVFNPDNKTLTVYIEGTSDYILLKFNQNCVKIVNSYKFNTRKRIDTIIAYVREYVAKLGYTITRSDRELYGEIKLHNFLYFIGYRRTSTADCDLDYVADKRWYVNFLSKIIGMFRI